MNFSSPWPVGGDGGGDSTPPALHRGTHSGAKQHSLLGSAPLPPGPQKPRLGLKCLTLLPGWTPREDANARHRLQAALHRQVEPRPGPDPLDANRLQSSQGAPLNPPPGGPRTRGSSGQAGNRSQASSLLPSSSSLQAPWPRCAGPQLPALPQPWVLSPCPRAGVSTADALGLLPISGGWDEYPVEGGRA